jgi:methylmalonyl-CoA mutase C-terminal domain/subunit
MVRNRVVLGSSCDAELRDVARRLRDHGHEVVLAGGAQSPEQLVRTAVAEDASRIVVPDDRESIDRFSRACAELGADDIAVEHWCDVFNAS